jgi:hypothetical protein
MVGRWLALAAAMTMLGGCRPKESPDLAADMRKARAEAASVVTDPARAARVEAAYDTLASALSRSLDERRALFAAWQSGFRDYDTPRPALEEGLARQHAAAASIRAQALRTREDVRAATTEAEWKQLAATRKRVAGLVVGTQ